HVLGSSSGPPDGPGCSATSAMIDVPGVGYRVDSPATGGRILAPACGSRATTVTACEPMHKVGEIRLILCRARALYDLRPQLVEGQRPRSLRKRVSSTSK